MKNVGYCSKHGEYEIITKTIFNGDKVIFDSCSKCEIEKEEEGKKLLIKIRENRNEVKLKELMIKNGIGKKYLNCKISNFENRTNISKAIEFCREPKGQILILLGKNGTGKTHLASAICIHHRGIYYSMFGLTNATLFSIEERVNIIKNCTTTSMLIIDEIGKQSNTAAEKNLFFHIVEERYRNELPTLLISNLDLRSFEDFVGLSISDRLKEVGIYQIMECESYRTYKNSEE